MSSRKSFEGPRVPLDMVKTTTRELEVAGRDAQNIESLKAKALATIPIAENISALLLPKLKPYAPGPGLDHMLFVLKENDTIGSVTDLTAHELSLTLQAAETVEQAYVRLEDEKDPIVSQVIALNYHYDPLPEDKLQRKLHAQTLKDLHVHVAAFRASDVQAQKEVPAEVLSKTERRDALDPIIPLIEDLVSHPKMKQRIENGLTTLRLTDTPSEYRGINFTTEKKNISSDKFAQDLQTIHNNLEAIYTDLIGAFINTEMQDTVGMPQTLSAEERHEKVENALAPLLTTRHAKRLLEILKNNLKSAESIASDPVARATEPIFLRNFAYTSSIIARRDENELTVNFAPRLLSTGNMLASLNLHKFAPNAADNTWIAERQKVERSLSAAFHQSSEISP